MDMYSCMQLDTSVSTVPNASILLLSVFLRADLQIHVLYVRRCERGGRGREGEGEDERREGEEEREEGDTEEKRCGIGMK